MRISVASVIAGLGLYWGWNPLRRLTRWLERVFGWGPSRWYSLALDGIYALARSLTRLLQNGYLRVYLQIIIVTAIGLVGTTLVGIEHLLADLLGREPDDPVFHKGAYFGVYEMVTDAFGVAFLAGCAMFLVRRLRPGGVFARSRSDIGMLVLLVAIGITGYAVEGLRILYADTPLPGLSAASTRVDCASATTSGSSGRFSFVKILNAASAATPCGAPALRAALREALERDTPRMSSVAFLLERRRRVEEMGAIESREPLDLFIAEGEPRRHGASRGVR